MEKKQEKTVNPTTKVTSSITEDEVTSKALERTTTMQKLKEELREHLKEFSEIYTISFGDVIEVLKDFTNDNEQILLQNVIRQICRQEIMMATQQPEEEVDKK